MSLADYITGITMVFLLPAALALTVNSLVLRIRKARHDRTH